MKTRFVHLSIFLLINGCSQAVRPEEIEATVVEYDASKVLCGNSWVIQTDGGKLRALDVPAPYGVRNTPVLIRYEPDTARRAVNTPSCQFIRLTSIRNRN